MIFSYFLEYAVFIVKIIFATNKNSYLFKFQKLVDVVMVAVDPISSAYILLMAAIARSSAPAVML